MLITGVSGQLGSNIAYCLNDQYDILGFYHANEISIQQIQTAQCDLLSRASVDRLVKEFDPQIVIHSAAMADVDLCEEYPDLAENVNVLGTQNLVNALEESNAKFVYISTDLVYDGEKGNYSEKDPVNPINQYGQTKLKGEAEAIKRSDSLIARTNFFGWNMQDRFSLAEWILDNLSHSRGIKGFTDSFFSSIYSFQLAQLIDRALEKNLSGIYHFASSTSLSKYAFAIEIAKRFDFDQSLIEPISMDDFGFKAKRAKNLILQVDRLKSDLNYSIPSIVQSIDDFYRDHQSGIPGEIKNNQGKTFFAEERK